MAYRCGQAVIGRATEPILCKVSGKACAHQRMCMMEGRTVLTDEALRCPARDGKLPEPVVPYVPEAPKKPAKRRKTK